MSAKVLYTFLLFLLHVALIQSSLQVGRLQVVNAGHSLSGASLGYSRNFSSQHIYPQPRAITTTAYFCSEEERTSIQIHPWHRLRAAPGSLICVYYEFRQLFQESQTGGFMQWYGTTVHRSPDDRTVADIVALGNGFNVLGKFPYMSITANDCLQTFSIPLDVQPGSLYSVYGMWNATDKGSLLVYTSCFDIEIIASAGLSNRPGLIGTSQASTINTISTMTHSSQKDPASSVAVTQESTISLSGQLTGTISNTNTQRASGAYTGGSSKSRIPSQSALRPGTSALLGSNADQKTVLPSTVATPTRESSGLATMLPSLSSSGFTVIPHASSIESRVSAEFETASSVSYMTIMGGAPNPSMGTSGRKSIGTADSVCDTSQASSGSATSRYSTTSQAMATSATMSGRRTSHTSSVSFIGSTSSASGTASTGIGAANGGNVGWGDTIKSSYSTETYCPSTDFCSRSTIISTSVESACVELVANGCTDTVVGTEYFFGSLKFTPNRQLGSCKDSAPLTVEGCEIGLMHAANYINSRLEQNGTLPCTGAVKLANKDGKVAGTVKLSGTCIPEYTG